MGSPSSAASRILETMGILAKPAASDLKKKLRWLHQRFFPDASSLDRKNRTYFLLGQAALPQDV